ncbi:hypothetical protein [Sedimenticola hydrogenitrophicus]|uniref:hypothetical protein n=1 Tax=Sedimenticola hydrogenitrophicus TaxID=2967975 RepID=UPI0021A2ACB1|nr:hypothetical protein [Sedimenticola hydrogenitrophicus]
MRTIRLFRLLILLTLLPQTATALDYPNRYNRMAETLFDMMDAFSSAYQKRLHERARDAAGYPGGIPGYGPYPGAPYPYRAPARPSQGAMLNGSWQGESGEILVIQDGLFRIYLQRDNFRDGRLTQVEPRLILMQDLESGQVRPYEFAESEGRLLLRDPAGNLLRYIRVGW